MELNASGFLEQLLESIVRRVIREELDARRDATVPREADGYATIAQVAEQLRINVNTVRRAVRCEALKASRTGGAWRIRQADVAEWLATGGRTRPQRAIVPGASDIGRQVEAALARRKRSA
jgi:excisionase family DNA binding protein